MSDNKDFLDESDGMMPVPTANNTPSGSDVTEDGDFPTVTDDFAVMTSDGHGNLPEAQSVREYMARGESDDSMGGGYASVNGSEVRSRDNKFIYIVIALMAALCIAVGVCSSVLTGYFMRKGEKPPVIKTNGDIQQNVAAVVAARKSSIVELSCGSLRASGIVMKRDGSTVYILTNAHAIEAYVMNSNMPAIRFYGEDRFWQGSVVGYDGYYDVAVVKVDHDTVYSVYDLDGSEFFSPDVKYNEGDYVVSIGNAMGMGIAAYDGIISRASELLECRELFQTNNGDNSGDKRDKMKWVPVMRTTAVINAGMSGGGVFDMEGHLVGLGTYRMSNSDGVDTEGGVMTDVEDTGFATPISVLYPIYRRIMAEANGGAVGLTNVSMSDSSTSAIGWFGMPFGFECEYRNGKLTVVALDQGTPSVDTQNGDVITQIGTLAVTSNACDMIGALLCYHKKGYGRALKLTLERDGAVFTATYDDYRYAV
ncbi:MAG: trypsin-like peptidase domain-containing protein [Clostridiales bacterium]|nr:trypsin-like peptidase domain-containing protein [Clostridiales bacterium]